jgi:hypothetical protein
MFLWTALKAIGGFFKKVFAGSTGEFAKQWASTIGQIVGILFLANNLNGSDKLSTIISIIKNMAAEQGKAYISHAARLLVELQLAKKYGDDIEAIIDDGLEEAQKAIASVNATDLVGDDERRDAAVAILKENLLVAKKNWLAEVARHLNLLIEVAVAGTKK